MIVGKFYLVDSGYPNRPGYLSPYKGERYHQDDWKVGPEPTGKHEIFNRAHSTLRSVIEHCFGVLKMKWRILLAVPSYPEAKQTSIILACCGLHNFVKENDDDDLHFHMVEEAASFAMNPQVYGDQEQPCNDEDVEEDVNMNAVRDEIANGCLSIG